MLYLIALFPIIVYVLIVKAMDQFLLATWKRLGSCFAWGLSCCGILFFASRLTGLDNAPISTFLEEFLKGLPLILAVCRKRVAFFAEALIYGTAIGAGFAFLENIMYVALVPGFSFGDAILRGFGTAILHMGCTALYAALAITVSRALTGKSQLVTVSTCLMTFVPSLIIHYLYNLFLLPEFIQLVLVILIMAGLLLIIYDIDGRLIHKWLDSCISNDISLLSSIREGHLRETSAGKYLLEVRRKFHPEVFFDICAYLGLYLELSIAAKSRMILKDAGMEIETDQAFHQENMEKLAELKALKKSFGMSGQMVLRPIIDEKAVDEWVMEELL